ncbi:hypothetical protein HY224_01570 [Candidatus Uhrbacteria bacterium]|nr:hypothetical protein [Candidatus Uhrbacteria bacterium]
MKSHTRKIFFIISNDLFWAATLVFVIFTLLEQKISGLISNTINPNIVLLIILLGAGLSAALYQEDPHA